MAYNVISNGGKKECKALKVVSKKLYVWNMLCITKYISQTLLNIVSAIKYNSACAVRKMGEFWLDIYIDSSFASR